MLQGAETNPWHLDCQLLEGKFTLLTYDFDHRLRLWQSADGETFEFVQTILSADGRPGSFYRLTLYRSCLVRDDTGYKCYFSAGNEREVKLGLMQGDSLQNLKVVSAGGPRHRKQFWLDLADIYTLPLRWGWRKLRGKS